MIIDAHQHFWDLSRGDYSWITPELPALNRNFLPSDLRPILEESNVVGTILVQATNTDAETDYMLDLASQNDWVLGVVGWVDLESEKCVERLYKLKQNPKFCGIRPMLQDIQQTDWILRSQIQENLYTLGNFGLTFDALVQPRHLEVTAALARRHPHLRIIIDHAAKPDISIDMWENWYEGLARIAEQSNIFCKISGLINEASEDAPLEVTTRYITEIIDLFGQDRVLWGSDWPVCTLRVSYSDWLTHVQNISANHHPDLAKKLFFETAKRIYIR